MAQARTIGRAIRERRKQLGLTQPQLADRTGGDISQAVISKWETGKTEEPGAIAIAILARALETTTEELLHGLMPISGSTGGAKAEARLQRAAQNRLRDQPSQPAEDLLYRIETVESQTSTLLPILDQIEALKGVLLLLVESVELKPAARRSLLAQIAKAHGDHP